MHGTASAVRTPPPSPSNEPVLVSIVLLKRMPQLIMRDIQGRKLVCVSAGFFEKLGENELVRGQNGQSWLPYDCHSDMMQVVRLAVRSAAGARSNYIYFNHTDLPWVLDATTFLRTVPVNSLSSAGGSLSTVLAF
jgi:hypothetical protein